MQLKALATCCLALIIPIQAFAAESFCPGEAGHNTAVLFCEDFNSGAPTSGSAGKFLEWNTGNDSFTWEASDGYQGTAGMKAHWTAGQTSAGWLMVLFGKVPEDGYRTSHINSDVVYRDIYWRLYHRTDNNWSGGLTNKLTRAFSFGDPSHWGQGMIGHLWHGPVLAMDPARGVQGSQLVTTRYNDFDNLTWLGAQSGQTAIYNDANRDAWFCIEAHIRLNTAGQSDGIMEYWINGELESRKENINWVGSWQDYGINAVQFDNYNNGGSPATRTRYLDNLVISTAPIGCVGTNPSPPPAEDFTPPAAPASLVATPNP